MARICGARVIDLRDAGVVEPTEHQRLVLESPQHAGGGQIGAQNLQRHAPPGGFLFRFVDHAHTAAPE
ncbi:MAG: hypothetical protein R3F17_10345 [Planctomycetota bacterium]